MRDITNNDLEWSEVRCNIGDDLDIDNRDMIAQMSTMAYISLGHNSFNLQYTDSIENITKC